MTFLSLLAFVTITLVWSDRSNNEDFFELQRCPGVACTNFSTVAPNIGANTQTWPDYIDSAAPGNTFCYRLRASNAVGFSTWSNTICITIPPIPHTPEAPTNLTPKDISYKPPTPVPTLP